MNRQQRRAAGNTEKVRTYTLTEDMLNQKLEEARKEAIGDAMVLMFTLPMEILMDHYWKKSYRKRIPEFTKHLIDYYQAWENDEIDINEMRKDLWEYGGVRLEINREKE